MNELEVFRSYDGIGSDIKPDTKAILYDSMECGELKALMVPGISIQYFTPWLEREVKDIYREHGLGKRIYLDFDFCGLRFSPRLDHFFWFPSEKERQYREIIFLYDLEGFWQAVKEGLP